MANLFKGIKKKKPMTDVQAPEAAITPDDTRPAVIVDQDGFFLRVEVNGAPIEVDLFEEEVPKEPKVGGTEEPVVAEAVEVSEIKPGDEVKFNAASAAFYGAETGTVLEVLSGGAEIKAEVNGQEQVMGVENLVK